MAQPPLFEHQKRSLEFLRKNNRVFDMSDPGTGKTRVAIEAFNERRMRGGKCALVIAPKSLLKSAWYADIRKFAPYLKASIAWAHNRDLAFRESADVYITNTDAAVWLAKQKPSFFEKFDTLIIDECGAYKHHSSQRSKAISKIKKYFDYRLGMNGTPNPNTVTDLWHQVHILDDGKHLGQSFYAFRQTVCIPKQVGPRAEMVEWTDRPGAAESVSKILEDMTIRHKFEDCIDIPENHEYVVPFYMNLTHANRYKQMQLTEMVAISSGVAITAVNAAATTTKLLQIASGAVYDENGEYHLIDTDRYDMVADMCEERQHTVVFFLWKHQKD
jgi:SNF2 family DNA or RNA helicase